PSEAGWSGDGVGAPAGEAVPRGYGEPTGDGGGDPAPPSWPADGGTTGVATPEHILNLPGNTAWYSSPAIADLDGDGDMEIIAPYYDIFVYDHEGNVLDQQPTDAYHYGRVYAPAPVGDLDGDGIIEVVVGGSDGWVAAYEFTNGGLQIKPGWPALACNSGDACDNVEVRGTAADDLTGDGKLEIVVTTTETQSDGAQVFAFAADGALLDLPDTPWPDWPRYNTATGAGGDADANGQGHHGYGCYGLNVGTGNIDDDPEP